MTPLLFAMIFLTLTGGETYRFQKDQIAAYGAPTVGFPEGCKTVVYTTASTNGIFCVTETPERVDEMITGVARKDLP